MGNGETIDMVFLNFALQNPLKLMIQMVKRVRDFYPGGNFVPSFAVWCCTTTELAAGSHKVMPSNCWLSTSHVFMFETEFRLFYTCSEAGSLKQGSAISWVRSKKNQLRKSMVRWLLRGDLSSLQPEFEMHLLGSFIDLKLYLSKTDFYQFDEI